MLFLQSLLSKLILIPTALMCLLPMKNHLRFGLRNTLIWGMGAIVLIACATAWLETALSLSGNDLLGPVLITCIVMAMFCVRAPFYKTFGVFTVALSLLTIVANLALCADALLGLSYDNERDLLLSSGIYLALGCTVTLPLAFVFGKYGTSVVDLPLSQRLWGIITILELGFFAVGMCLRPAQEAAFGDSRLTGFYLAVFIVLMAVWSLQLVVMYQVIQNLKKMAELQEKSSLIEMQTYQFDSLQRYIKASERTRHDFRHSLHTLYGLYEAGDYETLGAYLRQSIDELPVNEITAYTNHTALNALLNYYAHISRLNGIEYCVKVNLPDELPISDVDLCSMVGNVLENAAIACKRAEERRIQLTIQVEDGAQLYIVAVNTFDGYVRKANGDYRSTNRKGGGIGLSSVAATAEKYGGVAQFDHEGKEFYSNIAIPVSEQEGEDRT